MAQLHRSPAQPAPPVKAPPVKAIPNLWSASHRYRAARPHARTPVRIAQQPQLPQPCARVPDAHARPYSCWIRNQSTSLERAARPTLVPVRPGCLPHASAGSALAPGRALSPPTHVRRPLPPEIIVALRLSFNRTPSGLVKDDVLDKI
jgi:hypothetical protein